MKGNVGQKCFLNMSHVFGPKYNTIGLFACYWSEVQLNTADYMFFG